MSAGKDNIIKPDKPTIKKPDGSRTKVKGTSHSVLKHVYKPEMVQKLLFGAEPDDD